jgi:hypothetical protein
MTTNQNANVSMLDEQLDAVSGGIMPLPSPGPVEPRLGLANPRISRRANDSSANGFGQGVLRHFRINSPASLLGDGTVRF